MTWLLFLVITPFLAYLLFFARIAGFFSASALFAYFQLAMAVGTFPLLDPSAPADQVHAFVIVSTYLVYLVVNSSFTLLMPRTGMSQRSVNVEPSASRGIWVWIAISIAVCTAYYLALGYNVFALGIENALAGTSSQVSISTLRFDAYSGSKYLFPGYVNQFRNVLLPSLTVVVIVALFQTRTRFRWLVTIILAIVTTMFVLGTGQRGAFVTFVIIVIVFIYYANRRAFWRWIPFVAAFGAATFLLSTLALGRAQSDLNAANGFLDKVGVLMGQLIFRAFGSNQIASVAAFRYFYAQPSQHGMDWLQSLAGLLPGVQASSVDNHIFALLYGSDVGTAPPSIWGSAYYNFGLVGPLVLAAVLGFVCHWLTMLGNSEDSRTTLELIGMAGVFTVIGTWVIGDPTYLFNVGICVSALLWVLGARSRRSTLDMSSGTPLLHDSLLRVAGATAKTRNGSRVS